MSLVTSHPLLQSADRPEADMTREQPNETFHPDKLSGLISELLTYR